MNPIAGLEPCCRANLEWNGSLPLAGQCCEGHEISFHSYIIDYCKDYRACQQVTISAWVDREVPMPLRTFEKRLATLWSAKIRSVGPEGVRRDALGGHAWGALKSVFSIGIKVYNLTIPNVQVQASCGANECYTAFFNR